MISIISLCIKNKNLILVNLLSLVGISITFFNFYFNFIDFDLYIFSFLFLIALSVDLFDGYLARKLNCVSKIGSLLDTIHDIGLYLTLPFVINFQNSGPLYRLSFCLILIFGICRLARFYFKGLKERSGSLYYLGLPVYYNIFVIFLLGNEIVLIIYSIIISFLFVSPLNVRKLKPVESLVFLFLFLTLFIYVYY